MRGFSDLDEDGGDGQIGDAGRPLIRRAGARHLRSRGAKDEVAAAVAEVFERRLSSTSPAPIAVALSGGGDSVALLLAARDWALACGRPLLALTVDHRLQPQSAAWTAACAALAERLELRFQALAWTGEKPERGLPAAARGARHRLLAEAARCAGAGVILTGHTADDLAEARAMRAAGSTTPAPREWSPSPVWPEGRGLFLLRPLLGLRRARLRRWLAGQGESWIEDPANADPRYARARARALLAGGGDTDPAEDPPLALAGAVRVTPWGAIEMPRERLRAGPAEEAARLIGLAAVCVGGGARLPAAAARARLADRLAAAAELTASLAGARVVAHAETVRLTREAGEAARGGLAPLPLVAGAPVVWDGRFELAAAAPGLEVRPLAGLARRLPPDQQRALAALPAAARPGLPAVVGPAGVSCPLLGGAGVEVTSLVGERLRAAAGLIDREPA